MQLVRASGLVAALTLALASCGEYPVSPSANGDRPSSSESGTSRYVVSFKNDAIPASFTSRVAALGGTVRARYDGAGLAVVEGLEESGALSLATFGEVHVDAKIQLLDPVDVTSVKKLTRPAATAMLASADHPTAAFFYPFQWNMSLIGADVGWATGRLGSSAVKVAIVDTGIDGAHPDLVGLVDFANSASFVPEEDEIVRTFFPGVPVTTDLHLHGTHVAATVSSNAVLAAGVTSRTRLMAVKVIGFNGSGDLSGVLAGVIFAVDHGADIINMSLGSKELFSTRDKESKDFFNKVLDRAFKYAHSKGVLVVVAAGNESQDLDVPHTLKLNCGVIHTICVSAVGPTAAASEVGPFVEPNAFAPYSNFGINVVDVSAPGGNAAAVWAACSHTSVLIDCGSDDFVVGLVGTSQATPHVSGLAALLLAEKRRGNGAIRSSIFNSSLDLGAPGKDAFFGNGRIDVARALGLHR